MKSIAKQEVITNTNINLVAANLEYDENGSPCGVYYVPIVAWLLVFPGLAVGDNPDLPAVYPVAVDLEQDGDLPVVNRSTLDWFGPGGKSGQGEESLMRFLVKG